MKKQLELSFLHPGTKTEVSLLPTENERTVAARILAQCADKPIRKLTPKDYEDGRIVHLG